MRSLRLRLLIGAGAAIFVALAVAWAAMLFLFERHAQRQVENDLTTRGVGIIAALYLDPAGAAALDPSPTDPRFRAPASGLYWQVSGEGVLLRSRSLWDARLEPPVAAVGAAWRTGVGAGPFEDEIVFVEREVRLTGHTAPLTVIAAADRGAVIAARDAFGRELAVFLAILWAALAVAAWVQVELGLRPLEDVRAALAGMRARASARLAEGDYPVEAAPLAHAINDLAQAREADLEEARRRAGDLAHSLKTPLAALSAQSRRAREAGAGDAANGLDRAIAAADGAVRRELTRARAAARRGGEAAEGRAAARKLIAVISRTETGAARTFDLAMDKTLYPASEDVLLEMLGPLIENAARHARERVLVRGEARAICVEDDGAGLSDADAAAALERGKRLDERGDGHGLGLAIARALAEASGATLTLTRSELGGLCVRVAWE